MNHLHLKHITYPLYPENKVAFTYGNASTGNARGRIIAMTDATGTTSYHYDVLGRADTTTRRIILPGSALALTFRTHTARDAFGRTLAITYPDGERLTYHYDAAGRLRSLTGIKHGDIYPYIDSIYYNPAGQVIVQWYNNHTFNVTNYDSRQRLSGQYVQSSSMGVLLDAAYDYDNVNNITSIEQIAPSVLTMGGFYRRHFTYDTQNRLIYAEQMSSCLGNWKDTYNYSPAGRMTNLNHIDPFDPASEYANTYAYHCNNATHQPWAYVNSLTNTQTSLYWTHSGQLLASIEKQLMLHCWDDAGQLLMATGHNGSGYYGYDGNGKRVYKLSGETNINEGQGGLQITSLFKSLTIYPNTLVTLFSDVDNTPVYTKHYYAGTQHIATRAGAGGFDEVYHHWVDDATTSERVRAEVLLKRATHKLSNLHLTTSVRPCFANGSPADQLTSVHVNGVIYEWSLLPDVFIQQCQTRYNYSSAREQAVWFRHIDHLGSTAWVTDAYGRPVQYAMYSPYGQTLINQQTSGYDERFKFTGKERDAETGYDYFGARYYASGGLAITRAPTQNNIGPFWLSVDPLTDKYPDISPYAYCAWNPMKYVDPDGREKHIFINHNHEPKELHNDPAIYWAAENYIDNTNTIHIWAHGSSNSMTFYKIGEGNITKYGVDEIMTFLYENVFEQSSAWEDHIINGSQAVIVLHSCDAGKGDKNFAQQLSTRLPNTVIIAPNNKIAIKVEYDESKSEELGVFHVSENRANTTSSKYQRDNKGAWMMFRDGKLIGSFDGESKPNATRPEKFHLDE